MSYGNEPKHVKFHDRLQKNKVLTFVTLYEVSSKDAKTNKETILQADRSIMQRLIAAYQAGREGKS